jgi:hypothetical protein
MCGIYRIWVILHPIRGDPVFDTAGRASGYDVFCGHRFMIRLKPGVHIAWPTALGGVACDINKLAFFLATRTNLRRGGRRYPETAAFAFPESHAALGAYISIKTAVSRITALSAHHLFLFSHNHFFLSRFFLLLYLIYI